MQFGRTVGVPLERVGLRSHLIDDVGALEKLRPGWDALASELGRPFCAPAWMLAWWRHVAPSGARLRAVAVHDDGELIGIAPLFAHSAAGRPVRYRMLGSRASGRLEPLAKIGREDEVARAVVAELAASRPAPDVVVFEGISTRSPWPSLICGHWPSEQTPWKKRAYPTVAPTLDIEGWSFDEWFRSRGSHFRQEVRRRRRRLEEQGAIFRLSDASTLAEDLRAFAALHYARWEAKGGSGVLNERVEAMLLAAGHELVRSGRFRLWSIEVEGRTISSQLFVAAGGEVAYWLGGFDEQWAALGPAIQAVLEAARHAWEQGDRRLDLGAGAQEYKYSFANGQDVLEWVTIAPRKGRYPVTRLQLAPMHMREAVSKRLSPEAKERLKRVLSGRGPQT